VNDAPTVAELFRIQAHYCGVIGSPLYERLLTRAAADLEHDGPVRATLGGHEHDPPNSMLPLRFLGAVHRLVLSGQAPGLARFYPSARGEPDAERAWPALAELLDERRDTIRAEVESPVQTNEVARCAALLGGFLTVAGTFGLPLRVLEVGASAGLNLRWDDYFYSAGGESFGPPTSPVRFEDFLASGELPFDTEAVVADRRGCDREPLDPRSDRDRLLLRSFVWPDQLERFESLSAALELAREDPLPVERADAGAWAERELERLEEGFATVLFHSMVLMYLDDETRERLIAAIERAGRGASPRAPFAWLRMELGGDESDVRLTCWPGGEDRLVARAGYQGRPVRWLGQRDS
jgi:hypothetical protein